MVYKKNPHTMNNRRNINKLTPMFEDVGKAVGHRITHQQNIIRSFDVVIGQECWVEVFYWCDNDLVFKEDMFIEPYVDEKTFRKIHNGEKNER